jgi:hypothetical protein
MKKWQKVVLGLLGAWIVYSIAVWVALKWCQANFGKEIFGQYVSGSTIVWIAKHLYPYTIMGVLKIYPS